MIKQFKRQKRTARFKSRHSLVSGYYLQTFLVASEVIYKIYNTQVISQKFSPKMLFGRGTIT